MHDVNKDHKSHFNTKTNTSIFHDSSNNLIIIRIKHITCHNSQAIYKFYFTLYTTTNIKKITST